MHSFYPSLIVMPYKLFFIRLETKEGHESKNLLLTQRDRALQPCAAEGVTGHRALAGAAQKIQGPRVASEVRERQAIAAEATVIDITN